MDFQKFCETNNSEAINKGKILSEQSNLSYSDLINKYSNKTKQELYDELLKITKEQKERGNLSNSQLVNIYNTMLPMLNETEKENLKKLIDTLNKV